jgi:hypothetical protein
MYSYLLLRSMMCRTCTSMQMPRQGVPGSRCWHMLHTLGTHLGESPSCEQYIEWQISLTSWQITAALKCSTARPVGGRDLYKLARTCRHCLFETGKKPMFGTTLALHTCECSKQGVSSQVQQGSDLSNRPLTCSCMPQQMQRPAVHA